MLNRRQFVSRTLETSSLLAFGSTVPGFLATAAQVTPPGDNVLVVLEMTGGNDGLNTVVPYADDRYQRARPTLRLTAQQVVRVNDQLGLNPGLRGLEPLMNQGRLAIVQGVGYPNPNRSHFESMDVWQSGDLRGQKTDGWLGRGLNALRSGAGQIAGAYVGGEGFPLALRGSSTAVPTLHPSRSYDLELTAGPADIPSASAFQPARPVRPQMPVAPDARLAARRRLIEDLGALPRNPRSDLLQFVQRSSVETYATLGRIRDILNNARRTRVTGDSRGGELAQNLTLISELIAAGFGTRIFYASISGFDTHANQLQEHQQLLQQVGDAVAGFFTQLERTGHARRVVLMTFSEFGRRVQENGSRGTDHGAGSCLFVAGPAVRGGVVGAHPSLEPGALAQGDLQHHTDFRQVYATLLDDWLQCPSQDVLGAAFTHLPLIGQR